MLMLACAASLLLFTWALFDGAFYQYAQKLQFTAEVAGGGRGIAKPISLPETRPRPGIAAQILPKLLVPDPLLVGKLDVPRVGLSVMIREGMDAATLRRAVGHVPSTSLPGELGNVAILGHRDTFFRRDCVS